MCAQQGGLYPQQEIGMMDPQIMTAQGVMVHGAMAQQATPSGAEIQMEKYLASANRDVRMGFIRKVYSILTIQLITTGAIMYPFIKVPEVMEFVNKNNWTWYVIMAAAFGCLIAIACCPKLQRKHPHNILLLGGFTIAEACLLGTISSRYDTDSVLIAVGITAVVVIGMTIFAFQTKIDFTMMSGALVSLLLALICFGFLAYIFQSRVMNMLYCAGGVLLFSIFIVYDTQLIIGNGIGGRSHKHQFAVDDYVFGALNLYLDIINIFMLVLALTGGRNN